MNTLQAMACAIAFAMPQFAAAQADPQTPGAATATSPLHLPSAFADYKPYEDVPLADWRQVNETVRRSAEKGEDHAGHGSQETPVIGEKDGAATIAQPAAPREQPAGRGLHGGRP